MKYFILESSLNQKIVGKIPQVKKVIHNCHVWDNPNFIERFPYKKTDKEPILSNAVLYAKAKQTDLIEVGGIGFSLGSAVISYKLKKILEQFNCFGVQFFSTHIIHKNEKIYSYWQTHIYDIPYDFVDFKNTDILLKDIDKNNKPIQNYLEKMDKKGFLDMAASMKYPKMLFLKNISFNNKMNIDFFFLRYSEGDSYGIISEKLKNEIERQELTGMEFRPFELTLQEWFHSGKRDEIYQ